MIITVVLEQSDYNYLHDVMLEATDVKPVDNVAIQQCWDDLPESIKESAIHWGLNDSVVRDEIYTHLWKN